MIDITKKYTTQDGLKVTFYEVVGDYIHGRIGNDTCASTWRLRDGRIVGPAPDVLNLIPAKREFWVNVYPTGSTYVYTTRKSADTFAAEHRIACVKVTEGEGLDDE